MSILYFQIMLFGTLFGTLLALYLALYFDRRAEQICEKPSKAASSFPTPLGSNTVFAFQR